VNGLEAQATGSRHAASGVASLAGVERTPYWLATAPPAGDYSGRDLPARVDLAIVGGGITGLSAAIHAVKAGATVAVFDREHVGWGASGRNGGMCTTGASIGFTSLIDRYGVEVAARLWTIYGDAIDLVESLINEDQIDCDFARTGKMNLASKPAHFQRFVATHEALAKHLDYPTELVSRSELPTEIGSAYFHGGMIDRRGAGMHVGKYVRGLAAWADRLGAAICEKTPVTRLRRAPDGAHEVTTDRGSIRADHVLLATDGYTDGLIPRFQRRIVPVGSFIIVTEPLDRRVVDELMPTRRMAVDSRNLLHYFRITPDNRMLLGGRAQVALSTAESDLSSARILRKVLVEFFPQLADVKIDFAWGGHVGITLDRIPHAGEQNGIHYALGYNGHGTQMATYMGRQMVKVIAGQPDANPWRDFSFRAVPLHFGRPWFLPVADIYYRLKDLAS
jgi:glycine/D-amino acid oxidase-like deaminating enzyme